MDLSSLEGPPIRTPSSSACVDPLPHIQLDTSVLSPSHSDGEYEMDWDRAVSCLPPRPASTHAFASPRHRLAMETFDNRLGIGHIAPSSSSSTSSPRPRSSHAHPSTHNTALLAPSPSPSQRRHPTRLQSHSFSSPHQLVWLDAEKIWVVVAPAPDGPPTTANPNTNSYSYTTTPPARPSLPRLRTPANAHTHTTHTTPTQYAQSNGPPPTLTHARSMDDTFFANSELLSPNYDDLPPPYERHIYDRQLAVGAGVSRWTNVARRMNQSPY
ncbi:hypothetical protein HFD88_001435 [Aspergillus terreus]|nr:hypothetical protein HFD88_001435 [Aspergillus terreus]